MKIYYFNAESDYLNALVRHHGKPYLVTVHTDGNTVENTVMSLLQEEGDSCKFAFERFLKFALCPWYYFKRGNTQFYDLTKERVETALRDVS